jgi:hypothetical protein
MKSYLLWGIFISFICFPISSCDVCSCKIEQCSAFSDPNWADWFPYQVNQQIIFKNQTFFDTITIASITKSGAYEANRGCKTGDNGCRTNYHLKSNEVYAGNVRKMSIDYLSETPFESTVSIKNISFKFLNIEVSASDVTNQGLVLQTTYSGSYSSHVYIGGISYFNVQTLTKNSPTGTTIKPEPYKIYLSRGQGLVGYEMYPTNELWIKQ